MSLPKVCIFTMIAAVTALAAVGTLSVTIKEYEVPTPKSRRAGILPAPTYQSRAVHLESRTRRIPWAKTSRAENFSKRSDSERQRARARG